MMNKTVMRYSEAFKLKIVNELETSKFSCVHEARMRYDIRSCGTIELLGFVNTVKIIYYARW